MSAQAQSQKVRRFILTGAVASITATGAWYGASLKSDRQVSKVVQKQQEASFSEKIAILEGARAELTAKRFGLQKKLDQLEMRANGATREESMAGQERKR